MEKSGMKYQILLSGKNKKNVYDFFVVCWLAQRVVKIKVHTCYFQLAADLGLS